MKLVQRGAIKGHIEVAIIDFIAKTLPFGDRSKWIGLTEDVVRASTETWVREQTAYAIFSHRWLDMGELTFQDVSKIDEILVKELRNLAADRTTKRTGRGILNLACHPSAGKQGEKEALGLLKEMKAFCDGLSDYQRAGCQDLVKLVKFCHIASQYDCKYVWFDTGCIDKSKSAELEESIRSMFNWYRDAKICIVHLADTTGPTALKKDPWFTRGWTLQELLAPKTILFFGKTWGRITSHTKGNDKVPDDELGIPLWETISEITGIDTNQLLNFDAGIDHARDALTWVSKRQTTRIEDMAYCLIGLLQIPMLIAYGEGAMSFHRLQVEILQRSGDMGLFAWTGHPSPFNSMLAADAGCFSPLPLQPLRVVTEPEKGANPSWKQAQSTDQTYSLTNKGLRIPLAIYSARIQDQELIENKQGMVQTHLRLTEVDQVVTVESEDLGGYQLVGIAVLAGLADESRTLAVLLGMKGNRCMRIPTQEHIELSPIPKVEEPLIMFVE